MSGPSTKIARMRARIAELEAKVSDEAALQIHRLYYASKALDKASSERVMGGAVILTVKAYGGGMIVDPVAIRDGLSQKTIDAIREDLARSYDLTAALRP